MHSRHCVVLTVHTTEDSDELSGYSDRRRVPLQPPQEELWAADSSDSETIPSLVPGHGEDGSISGDGSLYSGEALLHPTTGDDLLQVI